MLNNAHHTIKSNACETVSFTKQQTHCMSRAQHLIITTQLNTYTFSFCL